MKPKEVLEKWIDCFNKADAYHIAELYATNAVNHQVANEPIIGKESIYKMFVNEFATAKMVCMVENIFEDGECYHGMERLSWTSWMRIFSCKR